MASGKKESKEHKESQEFKVPPQFKFKEGEAVICFHGPLMYKAKCLQARYDEKQKVVEYHIHYSGWNKSWDEWVPESRILKLNSANEQKMMELRAAREAKLNGKKAKRKFSDKDSDSGKEKDVSDSRSSTPISEKDSASDVPKRKRAKVDPSVESEEEFLSKVELKIKIPDELKPWLVDDWENICKNKRLIKLPTKINVDTIIEDFIKHKPAVRGSTVANKDGAKIEVLNGIREYFNVMLGPQLLYKFERKQYLELIGNYPNLPMSKIYGATHLLRLFVKLGGALVYTRLDDKAVQVLMPHVQDFLKFIHKNAAAYHNSQEYLAPPGDYQRQFNQQHLTH